MGAYNSRSGTRRPRAFLGAFFRQLDYAVAPWKSWTASLKNPKPSPPSNLLALIPLPPAHAHHLDGRLPPSASCKERKCIPLHTPACEKDIEWEKLRGNVSQLSGNRHQSEFQPNDPPAESPPPAPSATGLCGCVGQLVAGSQRSAASGGTAPGLRTPTGFPGQRKVRRLMVPAPTPAG